MQTNRQRPMESSSRILDAYVTGLRAEVARLMVVRDRSEDSLWVAQLDQQIELKLQLIEDVSQCLGSDPNETDAVEVQFDTFPSITSSLPAQS